MSREAVPKGVGVHGRLGLAQRAAIEDPPHVPWGESPPTQVEEQIRRVGSGRAVGGFEAGPTAGVPAVDRIDGGHAQRDEALLAALAPDRGRATRQPTVATTEVTRSVSTVTFIAYSYLVRTVQPLSPGAP